MPSSEQRSIVLNGKPKEVAAATLAELVAEMELSVESLVIEHNRTIVRQESWQTTLLNEGDEVEMLNFVGGG